MSETPKTIWVIEQGSYSEYRVVGVYSTEANARRVCEAINAGDTREEATVSDWPLDPAADEINRGLGLWSVLMLREGFVERVEQIAQPSGYDMTSAGDGFVWKRDKGVPDALQIKVWAESAEHAIKITNEKRGQMIALDRW